ncbi:hypothetical protein RRG08_041944 [Elysia crispata]|uniref:Uncharacterized protein n=1 Tax=Elysia crispata TaxID=231223 RepID=A0AAE0XXS4_9GAST|nr:hypothetical protein RRG08_041944 [Elysia crispata]
MLHFNYGFLIKDYKSENTLAQSRVKLSAQLRHGETNDQFTAKYLRRSCVPKQGCCMIDNNVDQLSNYRLSPDHRRSEKGDIQLIEDVVKSLRSSGDSGDKLLFCDQHGLSITGSINQSTPFPVKFKVSLHLMLLPARVTNSVRKSLRNLGDVKLTLEQQTSAIRA